MSVVKRTSPQNLRSAKESSLVLNDGAEATMFNVNLIVAVDDNVENICLVEARLSMPEFVAYLRYRKNGEIPDPVMEKLFCSYVPDRQRILMNERQIDDLEAAGLLLDEWFLVE